MMGAAGNRVQGFGIAGPGFNDLGPVSKNFYYMTPLQPAEGVIFFSEGDIGRGKLVISSFPVVSRSPLVNTNKVL
jgi:hypothetical protein